MILELKNKIREGDVLLKKGYAISAVLVMFVKIIYSTTNQENNKNIYYVTLT